MKTLAALISLVLLSACSRGLDRDDLPGKYTFSQNEFKQEIFINDNGSYISNFYVHDKISWERHGKWSYQIQGSQEGVLFDNFRFGMEDVSKVVGMWFVVPEKTLLGRRKLCFDDDLNRCFTA